MSRRQVAIALGGIGEMAAEPERARNKGQEQ